MKVAIAVLGFLLISSHETFSQIPDIVLQNFKRDVPNIDSKPKWVSKYGKFRVKYFINAHHGISYYDSTGYLLHSELYFDMDSVPRKLLTYLITNRYIGGPFSFSIKQVTDNGQLTFQLYFRKFILVFDNGVNLLRQIKNNSSAKYQMNSIKQKQPELYIPE